MSTEQDYPETKNRKTGNIPAIMRDRYKIHETTTGTVIITALDCDFVTVGKIGKKMVQIEFHTIPKSPEWFIYSRKKFIPTEDRIPAPEEEVSQDDVGLHDNQYLFSKNWDTNEIVLGAPFFRDYNDKSTPPYSAIVTGKFYKTPNGTIYYNGGFSIL